MLPKECAGRLTGLAGTVRGHCWNQRGNKRGITIASPLVQVQAIIAS